MRLSMPVARFRWPLLVTAGLMLCGAGPSPPQGISGLSATAPIVVSPSGAGSAPRVVSCPTCNAASGSALSVTPAAAPSSGFPITNGVVTFNSLGQPIVLPRTGLANAVPAGVCVANCAASTAPTIVGYGVAGCVFDGTHVSGHIAVPSVVTAGQCADGGTTITPGLPVLGVILAGGGAITSNIFVTVQGVQAAGGGSPFPISGNGSSTQNVGVMNVAGTNVGVNLQPTGTGAIIAGPAPDGTNAGGAARGAYSTDLQMLRTNPAQVAGGTGDFMAGARNTISGDYSAAVGYNNTLNGGFGLIIGNSNTIGNDYAFAGGDNVHANGQWSLAWGENCTATGNLTMIYGQTCQSTGGQYSWSFGQNVNPHTVTGAWFFSGYGSINGGQAGLYTLFRETNGAAQIALTGDGSAPTAANIISLSANNSSLTVRCSIVITDADTQAGAVAYDLPASAFTVFGSTPVVASSGNPSAGSALATGTIGTMTAAPSFVVDSAHHGVQLVYTPPAGNTDNLIAQATCYTTEVRF